MAIAGFIVVFLSAGGNGKADNDYLRSGQAHHAVDSAGVAPLQPSTSHGYVSETDAASEIKADQVIREALDEASADIKEVESQELRKEDAVLETEASELGNSIRLHMGGTFGQTLTFAEMSSVATQVEHELTAEVEHELHDQADQFANRDIQNIENMVEAEEEAGTDADEIEDDLYSEEASTVQELRDDIDQAADYLKDNMKKRAAEIEKQILEAQLSAKLGKKVKLVIVDDEVQAVDTSSFSGVGNLALQQPYNPYERQPQAQGFYGQPQQAVSSTYGNPPAQTGYGVLPAQTGYGVPPAQTGYGVPPAQTGYGVPPAQPLNTYGMATAGQTGLDAANEAENMDPEEQEQEDGVEETTDGGKAKSGGWW